MTGIADFVSKFQHGARSNLFRLDIPAKLSADTKFFVKAAQIPGKTINKIEMKYLNNIIPIAGETATFQDWSITVVNDIDYGIRKQLEAWMDSIKSNLETNGATNQNQYYADATVTQILQNGQDSNISYTMKYCFPTDLGTIDLSFDNQDQVQEFQVTFALGGWIAN